MKKSLMPTPRDIEKIIVEKQTKIDTIKLAEEKKEVVENENPNNCQWVVQHDSFYTVGKTIKKLAPGYYTYCYDCNINKVIFTKIKVITDDILKLPDPTFNNLLDDFQKFWDKREHYAKYEYVYKRAYLLYGAAGCGKTSLISLLAKELIKKDGIVLNIKGSNGIEIYPQAIKTIREIEKDKPIIVILEDIDGYMDIGVTSMLLNILDGAYQTDNVIIIATTNYPERLEERFACRPSRFDVRVLIDVPSADVRRFYIEKKLKPEDLAKISVDEWVKLTEGFTLDHLKELILMTFVLQNPFEESLAQIKEMLKNNRIKPVSIKKGENVGFLKPTFSSSINKRKSIS